MLRVLVVALLWLGTREVAVGRLSVGQLVIPSVNLEYGQSYLEYLRDYSATGGLLPKVIASYNAGPAPIAEWKSASVDDATRHCNVAVTVSKGIDSVTVPNLLGLVAPLAIGVVALVSVADEPETLHCTGSPTIG